jgi:hypothetical protein
MANTMAKPMARTGKVFLLKESVKISWWFFTVPGLNI